MNFYECLSWSLPHQFQIFKWKVYLPYFSFWIISFGWFIITGGIENNISYGCRNSLPIFKTVIYFSHQNFAPHINGDKLARMTPCLACTKYHTTFQIFRHQCELRICAMCICIRQVIHLLLYSQVCEENWWVGTVRLHILHGVPLVDTELVGWDPALVVADPGQKQAAWVVVMAAGHLACFVEWLEGWPEADSEREAESQLRGCIKAKKTEIHFEKLKWNLARTWLAESKTTENQGRL